MSVLPSAYHNPKGLSVEERLASHHGGRPTTWHRRMYGPGNAYVTVAHINTELCVGGEADRALTLMIPVDASLASDCHLTLDEALHMAEVTDAAEQLADESFRDKLRRGTATPEDAREYISKSVAARRAAETAEQAARAWIDAHQ